MENTCTKAVLSMAIWVDVIIYVMCKRYGLPSCSHVVWIHTRESARKLQCKDPVGLLCTGRPQTGAQQTRHLNYWAADRRIQHNWCSMSIRHKREEVEQKQEEVEQYHQLKRKTGKLWQCKKMIVIPIIIGALGTIDKDFRTWISQQCSFYMYTISFILFILFTYLSIYLFTFQYISIWRSSNSVCLLFYLYFTWSEV